MITVKILVQVYPVALFLTHPPPGVGTCWWHCWLTRTEFSRMLYPYRMVGHYSAWRRRAPWLKGQLPACVMGHLSAVSVLPSTHSSVLAPAERGSHPALPEGRPPLVRCRYLTGGSSLGFRSKLAKGWLQISPPQPRYCFCEIYPSEKRLYLQKAPVLAAQSHRFGFLWEIEHWSTLY